MNKATCILTAALLAGCAFPNEIAKPPMPANYRQLVSDQLPAIKGISLTGAEISDLSPSVGAQKGDWATCLKTNGAGRPRFFAVFFLRNSSQAGATTSELAYAVEARESILSDRCELATYGPLPPKTQKRDKEKNVQ